GQDAPLDSRFCPHCGRALAAAPAVWPTAPAGDGVRYSETAWFAEGERPPLPYVRPVNRIAWLLVISIFAAVMLVGIGLDRATQEALPFAILPALTAAVCYWALLYKAWACVQDGFARTSPGAALCCLFIPFFNLYWIFIAFGSWPQAYNSFADRHGIGGFRASPVLFQIFAACTLLPCVGVVGLLLLPAVVYQWCRAINSVARAQRGPAVPVARAIAAPPLGSTSAIW